MKMMIHILETIKFPITICFDENDDSFPMIKNIYLSNEILNENDLYEISNDIFNYFNSYNQSTLNYKSINNLLVNNHSKINRLHDYVKKFFQTVKINNLN